MIFKKLKKLNVQAINKKLAQILMQKFVMMIVIGLHAILLIQLQDKMLLYHMEPAFQYQFQSVKNHIGDIFAEQIIVNFFLIKFLYKLKLIFLIKFLYKLKLIFFYNFYIN